jgi:hypothetical protein
MRPILVYVIQPLWQEEKRKREEDGIDEYTQDHGTPDTFHTNERPLKPPHMNISKDTRSREKSKRGNR